MKHERPQKGNPHGLTVQQHCFPARSIERFAQNNGCVTVHLIKQTKTILLKPDDQMFCAKRAWDERVESGYMIEIEHKYQLLADAVVAGSVQTMTSAENHIITDMFALWNIRAYRKANPIDDVKIGAIDLLRHYTKDEQELLEKNGISAIRPDLAIPGRQLSGVHIQENLLLVREMMADAQWGILRASEGQFIVPDNFSHARILPVTPDICFFSESDSAVIDIHEVMQINRLAINSSREYYFANDLLKCPT